MTTNTETPIEYPCHKHPKDQWCDRHGQGGFMGHTCGQLTLNEQFPDVPLNLLILGEEASEVIQCVSKSLRFGLDDTAPNLPGAVPNFQWLEQEIGDFQAMVDILVQNNVGITREGIQLAKLRKLAKLPNWYGNKRNGNG